MLGVFTGRLHAGSTTSSFTGRATRRSSRSCPHCSAASAIRSLWRPEAAAGEPGIADGSAKAGRPPWHRRHRRLLHRVRSPGRRSRGDLWQRRRDRRIAAMKGQRLGSVRRRDRPRSIPSQPSGGRSARRRAHAPVQHGSSSGGPRSVPCGGQGAHADRRVHGDALGHATRAQCRLGRARRQPPRIVTAFASPSRRYRWCSRRRTRSPSWSKI